MSDVKTSVKMSGMTKTPVSNFRIPPDLKARAQAKAAGDGKTLTDVILELLREYVRP